MNEKDLIGKTIEKIEVDGYGIEMRLTDGTMFVYSASDGGYSNWDITKNDSTAWKASNNFEKTRKQWENVVDKIVENSDESEIVVKARKDLFMGLFDNLYESR